MNSHHTICLSYHLDIWLRDHLLPRHFQSKENSVVREQGEQCDTVANGPQAKTLVQFPLNLNLMCKGELKDGEEGRNKGGGGV